MHVAVITIAEQVNTIAIHKAAKDKFTIRIVDKYAIMGTAKIIALEKRGDMVIDNDTFFSLGMMK
jgi:hypothetical protein